MCVLVRVVVVAVVNVGVWPVLVVVVLAGTMVV